MADEKHARLVDELLARPSPATWARVRRAISDDQVYVHLLQEAAARTAGESSSALLTEAARTCLEALGDRSRGLILLEAALERDPDNADATQALAAVQRDADNLPWFESILSHRAMLLEERCEREPALGERAAGAYRRLADFYEHAVFDADRAAACRRRADELSAEDLTEEVGAYDETPAGLTGALGLGARSRREPSGGSLVAILREALREIEVHEDVSEGARFVLQLAIWTIHPERALLHLYDPTADELVVVAAHGPGSSSLVGHRTPPIDSLVADALSGGEALVVDRPQSDHRAQAARFARLVPRRSILCAPVLLGGRCLGAIELIDPAHFDRFGEGHLSAASFLAGGLANYLADRLELPRLAPPSSRPGQSRWAGG